VNSIMPETFAQHVLQQLPLAEAVLRLFHCLCEPHHLDRLFAQHRGRCYRKALTFPTVVALIRDALLQHHGSARQSFQRGQEHGELTVSLQGAYGKLGRLPGAVSEAFLASGTQHLAELLPAPRPAPTALPASLRHLIVMVVDGKVIKRVPKRLRPLRHSRGGVLGGQALVALELNSGLAVALATDPDGHRNETALVPALLPQVRQGRTAILWLADAQFGNPAQAAACAERAGDHFLLRWDGKSTFHADPQRPPRSGQDAAGRPFRQEWGWWGGPRNRQRRYVRRITLPRPGAKAVVVLTDLLDEAAYPAVDLLAAYLARWGIERVYQQITEVFHLGRLIGTTPQGTLFQLALCLLLYNVIHVVRAYVAGGAQRAAEHVSAELLFVDVRRQLIALHEVLAVEDIVGLLRPLATAALRQRLQELLHGIWTDRWRKAPPKKSTPPPRRNRQRTHASAYRLIQAYRLAKRKRVHAECQ
jgi:hypothetical protein